MTPSTKYGTDARSSIIAIGTKDETPLQSMEFSTDPCTAEANDFLASKPEFLREFCETSLENGLESTFGLIALKKTSDPQHQFVEFNSKGSSILKEILESDLEGKTLIQTSWRFTPDETGMSCEASCFSKCVQPNGEHYHEHDPAHNLNG